MLYRVCDKMKTKKLALIGFFVSLFLFNSALALPCAFFGEVKLDGSPTSGTNVEAYYLNGTFISKGKEPPAGFGHYSIAVNAPDENITLKIKGIPVDQGDKFCENGEPNYLNISATTPPTTSTTPSTTTTTPSGNGGGNGGGGSGVTTTTIPTTTTISTTEEKIKAMPSGETTVETTIPTTTVTTIVPDKLGITGAFLTAVASLGYWWILIIIIIVLAIVALIVDKKYRETKDTNSGNDTNPEQNMNPSNEQSSQNEEPKQELLQDPGN
jgi:hypothetical protein